MEEILKYIGAEKWEIHYTYILCQIWYILLLRKIASLPPDLATAGDLTARFSAVARSWCIQQHCVQVTDISFFIHNTLLGAFPLSTITKITENVRSARLLDTKEYLYNVFKNLLSKNFCFWIVSSDFCVRKNTYGKKVRQNIVKRKTIIIMIVYRDNVIVVLLVTLPQNFGLPWWMERSFKIQCLEAKSILQQTS